MVPHQWRVCLLTLGMLACAVGPRAAGEQVPGVLSSADTALLDRLSLLVKNTTTIAGHFTQRTRNAGDSQAEVREGRFTIQVPDCYNLIETRPDDANWKKRLCSDGTTQWEIEQVFPDVKADVMTHAAGAADNDLRRILSCVRGDTTDLQRDFVIIPKEVPGGYHLSLSPRSSEVGRDVSKVSIELDSLGHVQSLALEQPSGTRISLTVGNATYNQPVKPEDFHDQDP